MYSTALVWADYAPSKNLKQDHNMVAKHWELLAK